MRRSSIYLGAVVTALATATITAVLGPTAVAQPTVKAVAASAHFEVTAIHGYLYYHSTGKLGDEDIATGKVELWNTIIGEGDAGAPSSTVLIVTDVTGPDFASASGTLVVEAKAGKQKLARQTFALGDYFNEHGTKISLPLLVTGVGCNKVNITAALTSKTGTSSKTASLPFSCGE